VTDETPYSVGDGYLNHDEPWPERPARLYVVALGEAVDPGRATFTLSFRPDRLGWENDSDHPGYGLPLAVAQRIADVYNSAVGER
jgi:hypothetical protein